MFAPTATLHGSDASRTNIGATTSKAVYNVWGGTPRHPARLFAALLGITTVSSVCVFWYVSGFKCICIPVFRLCKLVTSACATLVSENKKQILARYVPGCLGVKDSNEEDLPFLARPPKKHDSSPQESHESDWTTESDEGEAIDNKTQKGRVTKTIANELEGVEEFYESSEHREALRMFMQHLSQPNVEKGKKKGTKKVVYHDHQDDENEEIIELTEATRITGKGYPKTVQRTNHEAAEEMFDSAFEEELLEEFLGDYINQRFADLHDEHGENEWEDVMEPYLFGYNEDDANGFLPQGDWSDLEEMGGGDEFESIVQQLWGSTSADPHQINYHSGNGSDRLFR